ncbi:MAG: hypothetical protein ABW185_28635 [Sedimenticola sp.]
MLDFLTHLFQRGCGYSAINTARSALSATGLIIDGFAVGAHPLVVRYMKGVFNLRPTKPKYSTTWDVSKVLLYIRKLSPVSSLPLKLLTHKLCMLIALTLASRSQSLHLLDVANMKKGYTGYTLCYRHLLKQARPGSGNPVAHLQAYPADRRLCVIFVLKEYLERTQHVRNNETRLFISYVKPHKAVTSSTVSRWLREVMFKSGIDCEQYATHSIRSASVSKAQQNYVPICDILKVAGWTNAQTFARFYNKPITDSNQTFANAVLTG